MSFRGFPESAPQFSGWLRSTFAERRRRISRSDSASLSADSLAELSQPPALRASSLPYLDCMKPAKGV